MLAIEGGAFAMVCSSIITKEDSETMNVPTNLGGPAACPNEGGGFSAIYAPDGQKIAQSTDQYKEQLVIADIDLDDIHRHKQMADCIGH